MKKIMIRIIEAPKRPKQPGTEGLTSAGVEGIMHMGIGPNTLRTLQTSAHLTMQLVATARTSVKHDSACFNQKIAPASLAVFGPLPPF